MHTSLLLNLTSSSYVIELRLVTLRNVSVVAVPHDGYYFHHVAGFYTYVGCTRIPFYFGEKRLQLSNVRYTDEEVLLS
ncbi:MAG: hypothetical protein ACI8WT_005086 [Clostridium sp.]|jgi:hypothetical protein